MVLNQLPTREGSTAMALLGTSAFMGVPAASIPSDMSSTGWISIGPVSTR